MIHRVEMFDHLVFRTKIVVETFDSELADETLRQVRAMGFQARKNESYVHLHGARVATLIKAVLA